VRGGDEVTAALLGEGGGDDGVELVHGILPGIVVGSTLAGRVPSAIRSGHGFTTGLVLICHEARMEQTPLSVA
jgi:hypothetical protein